MNSSVALGSRTWRWVYVAALIIAIVFLGDVSLSASGNAPALGVRAERQDGRLVVVWVQMNGLAFDAGVQPGDVVVGLNDRPVSGEDGPDEVAAARAVAVVKTDGRSVQASTDAATPLTNMRRISFLILAIAFMAVGSVVFLLAADLSAAGITLGVCSAAAAGLLGALSTSTAAAWALAVVFVSLVVAASGAVLFFVVFPTNRLHSTHGRRVAMHALISAAAVLLLYAWAAWNNPAAYSWVRRLSFVLVAGDLLLACWLAVSAFRRADRAQGEARRALTLLALGTTVGLAPFCLLALLPHALQGAYLVPADVAILPVGLVPLSLGVVILSRQFLGIRRVMQRGLLWLIVWMGLLALYLAGVAAAERIVDGSRLLAVAIAASTFGFVQLASRRWLERRLFSDLYDYKGALQALSAEMVGLSRLDEVAGHVLSRLSATLGLSWAAIAVHSENRLLVFRHGTCPAELNFHLLAAECGAARQRSHARDFIPVLRADGAEAVHCTALTAQGVGVGILAVGPKLQTVEFTPEDGLLLATLAPMLATALRNALLVRSLEEKVAILGAREETLAALSERWLSVQEDERRQLALDLHDDPLQRVILLGRSLAGQGNARQHLEWQRLVDDIVASLRAICADLRPAALDDFGLVAGLERLVEEARARSDLEVTLAIEVEGQAEFGRLEPRLEVALYRVAQEALNNCVKHAQASRAVVTLLRDENVTRLQVTDDGRGLLTAPLGSRATARLGVEGMRERLRAWHGSLTVGEAQAGGTVVTAEVRLRHGNTKIPAPV